MFWRHFCLQEPDPWTTFLWHRNTAALKNWYVSGTLVCCIHRVFWESPSWTGRTDKATWCICRYCRCLSTPKNIIQTNTTVYLYFILAAIKSGYSLLVCCSASVSPISRWLMHVHRRVTCGRKYPNRCGSDSLHCTVTKSGATWKLWSLRAQQTANMHKWALWHQNQVMNYVIYCA